jgi:uncharacterized paraquat-inducible protein A
MKKSQNCPKCHTKSWKAMGHRIVMKRRRELGARGIPIPCPECGANVDVPEFGEIVCPRCKWRIQ